MIRLIDLLRLHDVTLNNYKVHLATGTNPTPLEAYLSGDFKEWQEDQTKKNFECEMVLSLIHLGGDRWLFAGVYKILGVQPGQRVVFKYSTQLLPRHDDLIGRVIVKYKREYRASYIWGHKYGSKLEVSQILEAPMSIGSFPGYNSVCLSHQELRALVSREEPSWKSALSSVAGVYLITDKASGKKYVGSAAGDGGIWQRWKAYTESGHGGNKELKNVLNTKGTAYIDNFQYTVLEIADYQTTPDQISGRETHWKEVLLTREFGYNSN